MYCPCHTAPRHESCWSGVSYILCTGLTAKRSCWYHLFTAKLSSRLDDEETSWIHYFGLMKATRLWGTEKWKTFWAFFLVRAIDISERYHSFAINNGWSWTCPDGMEPTYDGPFYICSEVSRAINSSLSRLHSHVALLLVFWVLRISLLPARL